jgi:hypothetical protein
MLSHIRRPSPLLALSALAVFVTTGCGPKVVSSLPPGASLPSTIAVLPPDYSVDIPRERVDLVHEAIVTELRNQNFIVVEERVVRSICSTPQCTERSKLSSDYLVDGFATISLSSFSRNNFVAGYYNQLQGELVMSDKSNKELIKVDHSESESGGLLLQSGQVFQAIISTVKNSGDKVFEDLAGRFAQSVVERLPAHQHETPGAAAEGVELALTSASAQWDSPSSYSVCMQGTPHSFGYLLTGSTRTPLREVTPGKYCGRFSPLVAAPSGGVEAVELRTAFGNSLRRDIDLPVEPPCELSGRLVQSAGSTIEVLCSQIGTDPSRASAGCSDKVTRCSAERIVLYEAPTPSGPYTRVSEVRASSLTPPKQGATVAALAVSKGGVPSQPEPLPTGN